MGKTLQQALQEVVEEAEVAALRAHKQHFEEVRDAELAVVQQMEAVELRKAAERERRLAQSKLHAEQEAARQARLAASAVAGNIFQGLTPYHIHT